MTKLKVGDIVGIWQKPRTQESFEGKAELVEFICIAPGENKAEDWMVRFEGDDENEIYRRTVTF